MKTEKEIYKTELVPITFLITDRLNNPVIPTIAFVRIYDESKELLDARECSVSSNTMTMLTSGSPFDTEGVYKLVFEIFSTPYKFFHITNIKVKDF